MQSSSVYDKMFMKHAILGKIRYRKTDMENSVKVQEIIEQVKEDGRAILDEITVIREMAEENKEGIDVVAGSVEALTENSFALSQAVLSVAETARTLNGKIENAVKGQKYQECFWQEFLAQFDRIMAEMPAGAETMWDDFRLQLEEIKQEGAEFLGEMQAAGEALAGVESSGRELAAQVQEEEQIAELVTGNVIDAGTVSEVMVDKCLETLLYVEKMSENAERLIRRLGDGGFIGIRDIMPGMTAVLTEKGSAEEYYTEIAAVLEEEILIDAYEETMEFLAECGQKEYGICVIVNNAMYIWKEVKIEADSEENCYRLSPAGKPNVVNRRKYPRLPLRNSCDVCLKSSGTFYKGHMVNISAGGFAFCCDAPEFADAVGEDISIMIQNFELEDVKKLSGTSIRSTRDNGKFLIGCRVHEDNMKIKQYVESRMK